MQVEVLLDYLHMDTLTEHNTSVTSQDGQVTVKLNSIGGQVSAFVGKKAIISTDSLPKAQIDQKINVNGQNHFLTLIPTS